MPAAYLNPDPDPGSGPEALALQQGPVLARLAHAHADGAALGAAAALLRLRCDQAVRNRVRDMAAGAGASHSAGAPEADAAEAADSAGAAEAGFCAPVRSARGGAAAAAEPDQAQGAGPLLGALGAHLRRGAAFLSSGNAANSAAGAAPSASGRSRNGLGSAPGSAPASEPGLPLAAALRAVALLEAGGRALGCFRLDDPDIGLGAAEGVACAAAGSEPAAEAGACSPMSAAFEALLALHLRLLRAFVPPPEVRLQAKLHIIMLLPSSINKHALAFARMVHVVHALGRAPSAWLAPLCTWPSWSCSTRHTAGSRSKSRVHLRNPSVRR